MKKFAVFIIFCTLGFGLLAGCSGSSSSTGSSSTKDKFVGGKWLTKDING